MSEREPGSGRADDLRRQAEEKAGADEVTTREALAPDEAAVVLHELRVHQIELEMQNEELRRAQTELEASRARYFDLYDLAPVGYLTLSEQGLILEANLTAAGLLGVGRGALVRQRLTAFIVPEDQDTYFRHRRRLAETGATQVCEVRMLRRGVGPFWARMEATTVEDLDGEAVHRAVISDVADHKRADEERLKLEARLIEAQKIEAVGRLAGGVAHDFNNLLQAMLSQAQALQLSADSQELAEALAEIEAHIRRGASLTQQLLLFSRREVSQRKRLDLGEVITAAEMMLRRLTPDNIRTAVEMPLGHLWVEGDSGQLQQVVVNLALNARDAMPSGGTLTLRGGDGDGEVFLEVSDTGHGMDEETQRQLFEPFFTTKDAEHGTGLGLAVVHGIVTQHHGRVEVSSQPGQGSRFRVVLPVMPEPTVVRARPAATGPVPVKVEPPRGSGERVLVVEDEDGARQGLASILELLGYQVTAVGSGEEALALEQMPGFDVLLCDLMLPGIQGTEVAERLGERWPALRIVLMSGYAHGDVLRRQIAQPTLRFLQKPFGMSALAREVRAALEDESGGRER